jgi:polyisoprenyl-teichoic acid--peptidoglycan teichoic acid transferase
VVGSIALGAILLALTNTGDDPNRDGTANPAPGSKDTITTTLLFGTREEVGNEGGAVWLALASFDSKREKGALVYVPAHTAAEIPGRGLHGVGDALATGGVPLLLSSTENLMGIDIDRYVELSDSDARVLFNAIGPLTVDVPDEVRVPVGRNQARLLFTRGLQRLAPHFLVRLLYIVGLEGDDAELGVRHLAFWDALFETFVEDPEGLGRAVRGAGEALGESDGEPSQHAELFTALAALDDEDRALATLPVQQITPPGGEELYQSDADEIATFVAQIVGPESVAADEIEVQILNGNGVPGIGQEVAERLITHGFRVLLTSNAQRLDYKKTLIVTYDSSPQGQAMAERARDLLGVGEVQVSAQRQDIVDLTIVVGRDFLRAR